MQDLSLAALATDDDLSLVEEASRILLVAAAGPGKRHGELPGSMPIQPASLMDPRCVVLSDVGIGSPWGRALAWVRVRSRDVAMEVA